MFCFRLRLRIAAVLMLGAGFLTTSCFHKYETPITKNTQQPDKVLFDQAMKDIEHGRYETARISLQTLMNTYESSEYMAKAKLAVADSWYREGGANGMAQAEAEYKDFQLFYPNMEESAEAQNRICDIHYKEMDKSDRDYTQTVQAESECRSLITQYPNSKFVPQATQKLREIQESLAEHEFVVGHFYWKREMNPAAANRLQAAVEQYPLYSKAGEALYEAGDSYSKMGPRFRNNAADMFSRVVSEYPLSNRAEDAKKRLEGMEKPVPQVDQAALDREKYDAANYHHPSMIGRTMGLMHGGPDVSHAAKAGAPTMTDPKRTIPKSVPEVNNTDTGSAGGVGTGTTDVTASTVGPNSALDKNPDARTSATTSAATSASAATSSANSNQPLPTNRDAELKKYREKMAKKQQKLDKKKKKDETAPASGSQTPAQAPADQDSGTQTTSTSPAPAPASPTNVPATQPQQ
jgi:outer membrane protein assembly factor BamD